MVSLAVAEDESPLVDDAAKINYSVGYQIGSDFQHQEIEVRPEAVIQGIRDAMGGDEALMSSTEMRRTMAELGEKVAEQKKQRKLDALNKRLEESRRFHAENAKKPGVVTTASGLQYRVNKEGRGNSPQKEDKVLVHYAGQLLDGSVFDSSYKRGKPTSFQVDQVIKGWTEALLMMKQAAHWQLFIPPELAYGEAGAGADIPPNSTLIFEVELIAIQKKPADK